MTEYRKHHILPKTYLKYFSKDDSGKGIIALDLLSKHNKAEYKNQGDSIFWRKHYYKDARLEDKLAIEKFYGQNIEPIYNSLIDTIKLETEIFDWRTKNNLLKWIIYSKLRSPAYRFDFKFKIRYHLFINSLFSDKSSNSFDDIQNNIEKYSREYHLNNFIDDNLFKNTIDNMVSGLMIKKWKILIAPKDTFFWTSDNPGFSIDIAEYKKSKKIIPSKYLEKFNNNSLHFYPMTKNYCIEFSPYMQCDDIKLNFKTDIIKFERINKKYCAQINIWSSFSACNFVIMDENILK